MLELVLRICLSLLIVLGLMWGLARMARRPLAGRAAGAVTVLARQQLTRASSVAVVRVADRALVLGVTDGQVSLLGEADLAAIQRQGEPAERRNAVAVDPPNVSAKAAAGRLNGSLLSPRTWIQTVEFLRERTARR